MPTIEIDGLTLEVEPGKMIIEAADAVGIYIPRFCYHEKLSIAANCRMCLVEVEKAPKPLPACATPVADGMKISTASEYAVEAQKGTMEFLLINHPLDCPVCDQGGECPLQDQAMGFGKDASRFVEKKRVVEDKDIGPLIETEMTRCIHCTRCVRFGQEVAGIMELGMTGRGEHSEIGTFLDGTVDSEVSGNMIDLCPVGALTNKPYRFTARSWELVSHDSISPHDCVGTNINIQSIRNEVKRILPRENEAINECWLADRDRYSYEGMNSPERLTKPLIRDGDVWRETNWESALKAAAGGLRKIVHEHGADQLGALAAPSSSLEEFYLVQKLLRGLGSNNVDHRLRQQDFSDDRTDYMRPWLGCRIEDLENAKAVLLIGSNIRKEQPLLGLRVRKADQRGAAVMAINAMDYDFNFELRHKILSVPSGLALALASVARSVSNSPRLEGWPNSGHEEIAAAIGKELRDAGDQAVVLMGNSANSHAEAAVLRALTQFLAVETGARWGCVTEGNGVAGWVSGCVPHDSSNGASQGLNALSMLQRQLKGYLLLGAEPTIDCIDGSTAFDAMQNADCVVALTAFDVRDRTSANVLLPITPFSETPGTYINCEGRPQSAVAAVSPKGESRPAWKVLRVLGNLLEVDGFDYVTAEEVRDEVGWDASAATDTGDDLELRRPGLDSNSEIDLERISDVPLYRIDALVRRAMALQTTTDNVSAAAYLAPEEAARLGVADGEEVKILSSDGEIHLKVGIDRRVIEGSVYIPGGYEQTAALGTAGSVRVMKL